VEKNEKLRTRAGQNCLSHTGIRCA